ncbi:acyl carrier protein [Streptomyces sp. NPDC099088]|uniref:acyl carrier protein n=1 Tax=Streptomyces sp. NPDC099088 TaxID=3366101 RepID=UPI00382995F5
MENDIFARVTNILVEVIGVDRELVREEANVRTELELDSLSMLQLLTSLEDEFEETIDDSHIYNLRTVGDIAQYIQRIKTESVDRV